MRTITGVFTDVPSAVEATRELQAVIGREHLNLLAPGGQGDDISAVPTSEAMTPALGPMGGILGGALGIAISTGVPGIGQVAGLGLAAAAILGALGGVAGYKLGDSADRVASTGIPADELYYYRDALSQGRSVVIAAVEEPDDEERVRAVMKKHGAESLDAARSEWSLGLRDASEEKFQAPQ